MNRATAITQSTMKNTSLDDTLRAMQGLIDKLPPKRKFAFSREAFNTLSDDDKKLVIDSGCQIVDLPGLFAIDTTNLARYAP